VIAPVSSPVKVFFGGNAADDRQLVTGVDTLGRSDQKSQV
jgi:hypothetical protein